MNKTEISAQELEEFAKAFKARAHGRGGVPDASQLQGAVETKLPSGVKDIRPQISVVTVCYNALQAGRGDMFVQCLDSVQRQKGVSLEHIIVDGASKDGMVEFLKGYEPTNHCMRIVSRADSGIYEAMNRGVALAEGDYIVFLNTDDFYHNPEGMRQSLSCLERTGSDFSFAPVHVLSDVQRRYEHETPKIHLDKVFYHSVISHQSLVVKRQVMLDMDGFDQSYRSAADYEFLLRMLLRGCRGCYVPDKFVSYRMTGLSSTNIRQSVLETSMVLYTLYTHYLHSDISLHDAYEMHMLHRIPSEEKRLEPVFAGILKHSFENVPGGLVICIRKFFSWIVKHSFIY